MEVLFFLVLYTVSIQMFKYDQTINYSTSALVVLLIKVRNTLQSNVVFYLPIRIVWVISSQWKRREKFLLIASCERRLQMINFWLWNTRQHCWIFLFYFSAESNQNTIMKSGCFHSLPAFHLIPAPVMWVVVLLFYMESENQWEQRWIGLSPNKDGFLGGWLEGRQREPTRRPKRVG